MTLQQKWERQFRGLREAWKIRSNTSWRTKGIVNMFDKKKKQP